jgi:hypothetical protein
VIAALKKLSRLKVEWGPILGVLRIAARKFARMWALISQALIDKLQIIERYNHGTKRCRVLSQYDGTSSSDRRAIECPKAGNVRKCDSARTDRPAPAAAAPEFVFGGECDAAAG